MNSTRGSRVCCPVYVDGALLSGGDLHSSQGDGGIDSCGAIGTGGFIDFHIDLIKGCLETYGVPTAPIFTPGRVEPRCSESLTFIGVSVDHRDDTNACVDATLAHRSACLNDIRYPERWGHTGELAHLILGTSPIEGRIGGVVDIPDACCSVLLPTEILDEDIRPGGQDPQRKDRGQVRVTS